MTVFSVTCLGGALLLGSGGRNAVGMQSGQSGAKSGRVRVEWSGVGVMQKSVGGKKTIKR